MRFLNIKLFALVILLPITSSIFAYRWGFSNHTKKTLVIQMKFIAWHEGFYNIVKPGKRVEFNWPAPSRFAGYCLGWIGWAEYKPNWEYNFPGGSTKNGGLDLHNYVGDTKVGWWDNYPYNNGVSGMIDKDIGYLPYQFKDVEIVYLPDEVYSQTVKEAANIGGGFDTFLCKTIFAVVKAANKGQCPSIFSAIIEWIGGLIARSACTGREFDIYQDDKGNLMFTTPAH